MTDKKNWKDSLSAKAKELAPKSPEQESVDVEIGGKVVKIVRGDMSDEQWNHVKQRAVGRRGVWESSFDPTQKTIFEDAIQEKVTGRKPKEEPRPPEPPSVEKKDDGKISPADKYQIERLYRRVGKAVMEQEDNRDPLNDLQMQTKAMPQTQEDRDAGKLTDENSPVQTARIPGTSPDQGTPDEWKPMPRDGKLRESDSMSSAGVSGSTPMARMASMAQQAATGATPAAPAAEQGTEVTQQTTPATGIQGPASLLDPGTPADLERMGMGRNVPSLLQPQEAPNDQQMAARIDLGLDPLTAEPPLNPPMAPPGQQPPAPPPSGTGSASLDMSMTPQAAGPNVKMATGDMREFRKAANATKEKLGALEETRAAAEIIQDGITRESNKRRLETAQQMERDSALAKQAKLNAIQEAQRYQSAKLSVMEEARRAAADPTDPNRFWNNKTEGQKAAGIIAAALFGFTGQGMNWLNRVDALVENDMRAQMADRSAKVQGLQSQAQALGEAGQMAMQRGATEAEAYIIDKQAKYEGLQMYLQGMAEQSKNMDQKVKYAEMAAQMADRVAGLELQGAQLSEMAASHRNQFMLEREKMRIDAEQGNAALRMKAASGGAGSANRPLPEAGAKLMDEYSSAVQALQEMQGKLKNSGPGNRLLQKFAQSNFIPGNADEKALYNDYRALKYKWMTLKARGALQGIEIAALEDMLPERGQVMSDPAAQVGAMEQTAVRDFQRAISQQEAAGFEMSRYKSMVGPSKPQYGNVQFQPK